jgi:uncharacterized damage-inducible protein DinB
MGFEGGGLAAEFCRGYEVHQGRLVKMIAPLDQQQLDLAAAPHLWSVRTLACHIIGVRAGWFNWWMGEGPEEFAIQVDAPDAQGERPSRSRQWIVWHLVEHDVHHGGEISFSLGMHGVAGLDL